MSNYAPDRNGKNRLLPTLAGLFFLAWLVAVFFAVRDTFFQDRQSGEPVESGSILALPDSDKGRFPILDRGGRELAVSFPAKSVYARPLEVEHPDAVALFLARELGLSERDVRKDLKEERSFVWLGRQVPEAAVNNIRARKLRGIYVVDESQRFYPQGPLAAQLLGFAREGRGLTGIEAQFDQQLQTTAEIPGETGPPRGPLLLTLDLRVQELLERELAQLAAETGATGGEGIVLDPQTGEVLALVNLPAYEPNFFWDFDENSRTNRVLSLALPASGFGQLLKLATSPDELPVEIPAPVQPPAPSSRDRLAALKKQLRKGTPAGTFGSGPGRLVRFEGGYRSPGLAALMKLPEPPGFASFTAGLGLGQKVVMELPVGELENAAAGERAPTFRATGGELIVALARILRPDGAVTPRVVAGVVDPQSGRVQALARPDSAAAQEAEKVQRVRDYLGRLAGESDMLFLEELTEVPAPVKEEAAEPTAETGGREVGQVWEPGQPASPSPAAEKTVSLSPGEATAPAGLASGSGGKTGAGTEKEGENPNGAKEVEEAKHFISLLTALPAGEASGVVMLLALEGAVLDPTAPSPLRLAAERIMPQVRGWAAENIGPPATISWSANEPLWRAQWQKIQASRSEKINLDSRANRKQMPDLRGASLRKALQVLNHYGLKVRIQGGGRVVEQRPAAGEVIRGDECILILSGLNLVEIRPSRQLTVGLETGSDKLRIISSTVTTPVASGGGN